MKAEGSPTTLRGRARFEPNAGTGHLSSPTPRSCWQPSVLLAPCSIPASERVRMGTNFLRAHTGAAKFLPAVRLTVGLSAHLSQSSWRYESDCVSPPPGSDRLGFERIADHHLRAAGFKDADYCPGVCRRLQRRCAIPTEVIMGRPATETRPSARTVPIAAHTFRRPFPTIDGSHVRHAYRIPLSEIPTA